MVSENYRGNLTYTLPVKYKVIIAFLAILSLSLLIAVIVQAATARKWRRLTKIAELDVEEEFENFMK